ncbi:MAG: DNA gyrase C-terminal beta-propeller domain-containing protein, partial [Syntrophomonas sp.]|nr:DNA gyrase C-terminal beta-propeller domain-containing protein [Syntrophomonas sp.]
EMLSYYVEHRQEVVTRRTIYDLNLANKRKHILEGLLIALDNIDEIVKLIRSSKDRETARNSLIQRFGLTEIQANAILDMRLAQLTGLERSKLEGEFQELLLKIADYEDILAHPERVLTIIKEDLDDIKARYGDKRRTEISADNNDFDIEDFIEDHEVVITLSHRGYIKRQPLDTYKTQKRGGKGVSSISTRAEDFASEILVTGVLNNIIFFTNQGRAFISKAYQIPESSRQAKGQALINFLELRAEEKVTTIVTARAFDDTRQLIMATKKGVVKKVAISAFENIRRTGIIAINLGEEDELVGVIRVDGLDKVIMITSLGQSIMFDEGQVRSMGRTAAGVRGIRLSPHDFVVGIDKYRQDAEAVLVTEKGYGKRTKLTEFKLQNRGGKGIKTMTIKKKNGPVVGFKAVNKGEEIVILTTEGQIIRLEIEDISTQKRYSRGVLVMRTSEEDKVAAVARFKIDKEE